MKTNCGSSPESISKSTSDSAAGVEKLVSLRQEIWNKRNEFARNNYGKYPNSLILSRDVNDNLIKECEAIAKKEIITVGEYKGMEISILSDYRKEKIIKVAWTSS